jgi:uncharacterized protein YybS (DUF2232 family)
MTFSVDDSGMEDDTNWVDQGISDSASLPTEETEPIQPSRGRSLLKSPRTLAMVETAFLASTASLIWLINYYFPLGPVLTIFFSIPIALVYLRWGHRSALKGVIVAGLLLCVLMGPTRSIVFLMPYGLLSLQLGFAVIPLIHFTNSPELMGKFKNKRWLKILAWTSAIIIIGLNIKLVGEELKSFFTSDYGENILLVFLLIGFLVYISFLLVYVAFHPWFKKTRKKALVPHLIGVNLNLGKPNAFKRVAITVDFGSKDEASIRHALT